MERMMERLKNASLPDLSRLFSARRNTELVRTLLVCALIVLPLIIFQSFILNPSAVEVREHAPVDADAMPSPLAIASADRPQIGYDMAVISALREMGVTIADLDSWMRTHKDSSLHRLRYMSSSMQQIVSSTALFIRKANSRISPETAWREATALIHYSAKYGVPTALATAVAHTESTFDPNAVSKKGASGVMQVMWRLHDTMLKANGISGKEGRNPLADPEQAIAAGCLLLSRYIRAHGSVPDAMERYYGGRSAIYQGKIDRTIARVLGHHAELYK